MVLLIDSTNAKRRQREIRQTQRVRKSVFVDRLHWNVPVVDGEYEIDQYDTDDAVYLTNIDRASGDHLASVRLLPTTGPYVLGDLFPSLCEGDPPSEPQTWEITRLCTTPGLDREIAAKARHKLAVALVEYGLLHGIERYVCVIGVEHISALIAPGWKSTPLGPPQLIDGAWLGAFALGIAPATLDLMTLRWGGRLPVLRTELVAA